MRIRAALETNRSAWVQYVLPPDNVLPDDLAAGSSSSGDASNSFTDMDSRDDEELDQLMKETRAVLARYWLKCTALYVFLYVLNVCRPNLICSTALPMWF